MKFYIKANTTDILDDSYGAQWAAASDPNTRASTLVRLTESKYVGVRMAVASNRNIPEEAVNILMHDSYRKVRKVLSENKHVRSNVQFRAWEPSGVLEYTYLIYEEDLNTEDIEVPMREYIESYGFTYLGGYIEHHSDDLEISISLDGKFIYRFQVEIPPESSAHASDILHDGTTIIEDAGFTVYSSTCEELLKP